MATIPFPRISIDCFVMSLCRGILCCFPLVGGMASLTMGSVKTGCAKLSRPKTQGSFLRGFPLFIGNNFIAAHQRVILIEKCFIVKLCNKFS